MKIQDDIKMYAQILNEAAELKARYEEACNEFEKHRNDLDNEIDEAAIVVDAAYIQKATKALEPLKAKDKDAYDNALKYLKGQKGHQLAVDAETFAKNRIARANAAAGAAEIQTTSKADDRWEMMQKVAADKKAARDKEEQEKMAKVFPNEITITDVEMVDNKTCKVAFEIKWSDGKDDKDEYLFPIDDEEFIKAKRSMGAKSVESASVALLQQSYDSLAARPIKWTFFNKKTGIKQDGTKFMDVVQAKKRIVKQPKTIDPAKEKAYELADGYNKQFGNANLRYSVKESASGNDQSVGIFKAQDFKVVMEDYFSTGGTNTDKKALDFCFMSELQKKLVQLTKLSYPRSYLVTDEEEEGRTLCFILLKDTDIQDIIKAEKELSEY